MAGKLLRRLVLAALAVPAALACDIAAGPAAAQDAHMTINPAELSSSRQVSLGLGKSLVIDLPRDAKDVLVSNPVIADAVMRTARRAYLIGMTIGQTNVFFFDVAGRQIAVLEVQVERDIGVLAQSIRQLVPGSAVRVEAMNDNIVLAGMVKTPSDSVKAFDIAAKFVGDKDKVLNMLSVEGNEQVFLKVTVAEVKRNALKQFGIDLKLKLDTGGLMTNIISEPFFGLGLPGAQVLRPSAAGVANAGAGWGIGWSDGSTTIGANVKALEQQGVLRVLSEPTLSAISGESANFLAGGEFPVPTGYDRDSDSVTIEYKPFGVGLNFTPVVMTGGRISLKVKTEVSELTNESAVTVGPIRVPGLKVRRADTTVELPSGGSLVLAGLISQDTKQVINGVPGLKDVPILGTLFRSRDFVNDETELVVLATPYMVKPVARSELARPDDNYAPASDPATIFLGRINRLYGLAGTNPAGNYRGPIGFIVE